MSNRYPMPSKPGPGRAVKPTNEYLSLCTKSAALEDRGLHRRASRVWSGSLAMSGLTERERDLCVTNAHACSSRAKYIGKSED